MHVGSELHLGYLGLLEAQSFNNKFLKNPTESIFEHLPCHSPWKIFISSTKIEDFGRSWFLFILGLLFQLQNIQKKWWSSNLQKHNFMIDKHPKHPTAWHPCYPNPTSATLPIAVPTLCRSAVARMRQLPRRTVGASSSLAAAAPGLVGLVGWWGASLRKLRFLEG